MLHMGSNSVYYLFLCAKSQRSEPSNVAVDAEPQKVGYTANDKKVDYELYKRKGWMEK